MRFGDDHYHTADMYILKSLPLNLGSLARAPWPGHPHWCAQWPAQIPPPSASTSGGHSPMKSETERRIKSLAKYKLKYGNQLDNTTIVIPQCMKHHTIKALKH